MKCMEMLSGKIADPAPGKYLILGHITRGQFVLLAVSQPENN